LVCSKRRRGRLFNYGRQALLGQKQARGYSHVAWLMVGGLALVLTAGQVPFPQKAPSLVLFCALAVIAVYDASAFIIPDLQTGLLAAAGLAFGLAGYCPGFAEQIAACAAGYLGLRGIALAYFFARSVDGMGHGDAKLLGAGGLWIGLEALPLCMLFAVFSALATVAVQTWQGRSLSSRSAIPFGPHLALGIWLAWLIGQLQLA
jgi:leader peptidase (prepilin peptidase) / N-methyltransferase